MAKLSDFDNEVLNAIDVLSSQCRDIIRNEAIRLLTSGAIDPSEGEGRPMWIPKLVVAVACEYAASQWENRVDGEWMKARKNLRSF